MANNTMTKLATTTVGSGGASSVTFSAIPQTYTDLVVKISARGTNAAVYQTMNPSFNGSIAFNNAILLYGSGSSAVSVKRTPTNPSADGANATANTFGNTEIYIPNYTSSNFKSFSIDVADENNGTEAYNEFHAGINTQTLPITSFGLSVDTGSFVQYSEFTLYGVYSGGTTTPSAPTIASATDLGGGTAQVTISSPAAIPYTVTSSPSGITATGMSPIQISGLSPQTAYTFTAQAVAPFGVSAASSASSSVSMYNGMTALATVSVGSGGSSSVSFSSIPSGYSHLQVRGVYRDSNSGTGNSAVLMQFNGDSGANYARHALTGDGSSATAGGQSSQNWFVVGSSPDNGNTSNVFGANVVDILDYSNTSKYKTTRSLMGFDTNGAGQVELRSGLWQNTAAISSITLSVNGGFNFQQYSTFVLYGVK